MEKSSDSAENTAVVVRKYPRDIYLLFVNKLNEISN